jgi:DNA-directed RNA polymerase specialized sigma24 family protein
VALRQHGIALDEALTRLAQIDPRKAHVVELRFFGGLSAAESAAVLKVSEETILRDWRLARVKKHRGIKVASPAVPSFPEPYGLGNRHPGLLG